MYKNPVATASKPGTPLKGALKQGAVLLLATIFLSACATGFRPLSESVYQDPNFTGFSQLPNELQTTDVRLLYLTDRRWELDEDGKGSYRHKRSRHLEFGYAHLDIGGDMDWEALTDWTLGNGVDERIEAPVFNGVTRVGAFPDTPPVFVETENEIPAIHPTWQAQQDEASAAFQVEIRSRLTLSPIKDIVLGVHGIQTSLEVATSEFALWWHMGARQWVPISYSWPAGQKGAVSFYAYDRESGEFTNYHLKQALRIIAETPEVEGIHFFGHSRGTDVILTALRELIIEERAAGRNPKQTLKLKNLVLMAADMDFDVVSQSFEAEALWTAFDRVTTYATSNDSVLAGTRLLFSSEARLGELSPEDMPESYRSDLWADRNVDLIFYEGGFEGQDISSHSYYLTPSVSADLTLLMRGRPPGKEHGRPLKKIAGSMYSMEADYLQQPKE